MGPVFGVRKVAGGWIGIVLDRPGGKVLHRTDVVWTAELARLLAWRWRSEYLNIEEPANG